MTAKSACFSVTGEFITGIARDFVIENRMREAERLLLTSVSGLEHRDMIQILKGEAKLVGDSNTRIDLESDDDQEYKESFKSIFGGIVYDGKSYWKPYAQVVGWGPRDVGAGEIFGHPLYNYGSTIPVGYSRMVKFSQSRNVAYMNNKLQDLQHNLLIDGQVSVTLWERTDTPPFWVDIIQDSNWQLGLDVFLASGNRLNVRDHTSWFNEDYKFFPSDDKDQTDPISRLRKKVGEMSDEEILNSVDPISVGEDEEYDATPAVSKFHRVVSEFYDEGHSYDVDDEEEETIKNEKNVFDDLLQSTGLPDFATKGMAKFLSNDEDVNELVPVDDSSIAKVNHGYILKDGRFYACEYHFHASLAQRLFKMLFDLDVEDSEKEADNAGWLRISRSAFSGEYSCEMLNRPTKKQLEVFLDWGIYHGVNEDNLVVHRISDE